MKKFILSAAAVLLFAFSANAQLGLVVGVTSASTDINSAYNDIAKSQTVSQYHAGLVYNLNLPLGLSVQPGILYNVKGQSLKENINIGKENIEDVTIDTKTGYLEVPVRVGFTVLNLGLASTFLFAEPYLGYAITTETVTKFKDSASKELASVAVSAMGGKLDTSNSDSDKWVDRNRLSYGIGVGAGVKVLKFASLSVKYFWDLGAMYKDNGDGSKTANISTKAMGEALKSQKCSGIAASLTLYF